MGKPGQVQAGGSHLLRDPLKAFPRAIRSFLFPTSASQGSQDSPALPARARRGCCPGQLSFPGQAAVGFGFLRGVPLAGHGPSVNGSTVLLTWVKNLSVQLFSIRRLKLKICGQSNLIYDTVIIIINVVFSFVW